MANELTISTAIGYSKSNDTVNKSHSKQITVAGSVRASGVQSIATSETALDLGGVTAVGIVFLQNLDPTNYVEVGTTTAVYAVKIKAGEAFVFRSDGNTVYCKASTAAVKVAYEVFSE